MGESFCLRIPTLTSGIYGRDELPLIRDSSRKSASEGPDAQELIPTGPYLVLDAQAQRAIAVDQISRGNQRRYRYASG
jgi:hypothetical protein